MFQDPPGGGGGGGIGVLVKKIPKYQMCFQKYRLSFRK